MSSENVGDGRTNEVCLPGDRGFVSGSHLLPLVLAALLVLALVRQFLGARVRTRSVRRGRFCNQNAKLTSG